MIYTPKEKQSTEQSSEKKEWYDYALLNLIVKYVKKAQAEGKL